MAIGNCLFFNKLILLTMILFPIIYRKKKNTHTSENPHGFSVWCVLAKLSANPRNYS